MNPTANGYDPNAPVKALVIRPGDNIATPTDVTANDLDSMVNLVGGWLEALDIAREGQDAIMWFDEEGKMKRLPVNELANWLLNQCGRTLMFGDKIVGTVIVTGVAWDGDMRVAADIPAEIAVLTEG